MILATVTIDRRFRGPPTSANGGYVVGLLGRYAPEPVAVRIRVPPPLDRPLEVHATADDGLELRDAETVFASGSAATVELALPEVPSFAEATDASQRYPGFRSTPVPECFVCGPARLPGDGLRVFPGLVGGRTPRIHAAPWMADASLAGTRKSVRPEFIAAALDCPGYYAIAVDDRMLLLGSMALTIDRAIEVGEPCVVASWSLGGAGRKWRAATAVFGRHGDCAARAIATWIDPKRD